MLESLWVVIVIFILLAIANSLDRPFSDKYSRRKYALWRVDISHTSDWVGGKWVNQRENKHLRINWKPTLLALFVVIFSLWILF